MTYCVGIKLNAGLVFLTDSRTNAGVDHISTFRKMIVYERRGDRFMVLLSAGNLSIAQSVREILQVEQLQEREDGEPLLKAGMLARVTLPTGPKQNALMVPKDALILSGSSAMVYIIDPKTIETVADPASGMSFHQAPVQPESVQLGVSDGHAIA